MTWPVSLAVIIPAYNVQAYVSDALQSLHEQSVRPDEIIIIDDGSTDGTPQVLEKFSFKARVVRVSTRNRGQGSARNLGLHLAASDYVYFFDADDVLDPDFVKRVKNDIRAHGRPDMLLFSGAAFLDNPEQAEQFTLLNYDRGFEGVFEGACQVLEKASQHGRFSASPCLYVSRRALWQASGLEFGSLYYEDEALFFPLLQACSRIVVADVPLFWRRLREGSTMTMVPNQKHVAGGLAALKIIMQLLNAEQFSPGARKVLRAKIEMLSLRYLAQSRQIGASVEWRTVLQGARKSPGLRYWRRLVLYSLGIEQSRLVKMLLRQPRAS